MKKIFDKYQLIISLIFIIALLPSLSARSIQDPSLKKLRIVRLEQGNGRIFPAPAAIISVDYIIRVPSRDLELRNSYISKEPMKMQLGWDDVIQYMSLGEKVKFYCSKAMGYDDCKLEGEPDTAEIVFILELIEIEEYKKERKKPQRKTTKKQDF